MQALLAVLFIGLCWLVLAFAAAAEAALHSLTEDKITELQALRTPEAIRLTRLLKGPIPPFAILSLVKTFALVSSAVALAGLLTSQIPQGGGAVLILATVVGLGIALLLQFLALKLGQARPDFVALRMAVWVELLTTLFRPLFRLLGWSTGRLFTFAQGGNSHHPEPKPEAEDSPPPPREEGEAIIERRMIEAVFEMGRATVREVMVPRPDMVTLEADASFSQALELISDTGFSRIPLFEGNVDNIVGVIYAKDLLKALNREETPSLRTLARPPYFVPETKRARELLEEIQKARVHIAIVVDEYGATAGLVTIEDIVEGIVGAIEDEHTREEPKVEWLSEGEAVVDGRLRIEELNNLFKLNIEGEGFNTVGGLVISHLGKLPEAGDEVEVYGLKLSVLSTLGRRVKSIRITRLYENGWEGL